MSPSLLSLLHVIYLNIHSLAILLLYTLLVLSWIAFCLQSCLNSENIPWEFWSYWHDSLISCCRFLGWTSMFSIRSIRSQRCSIGLACWALVTVEPTWVQWTQQYSGRLHCLNNAQLVLRGARKYLPQAWIHTIMLFTLNSDPIEMLQ